MTHDEIQMTAYVVDMQGGISAMVAEKLGDFPSIFVGTVFEQEDVLSEHYNLLRSTPILYQTLTGTYTIAQGVMTALESYRGPERHLVSIIVHQMQAIQDAVLLAQNVAINGIETVRTEIQAGAKVAAYAKEKPK